MTSAAERYGKVPEALSPETRRQVAEIGKALVQSGSISQASPATHTVPAPTPPSQVANDAPRHRGRSL